MIDVGNPQGPSQGINLNPISNPTHPAHAMAARHFGAAIGHMLIGDNTTAAQHLSEGVRHTLAPHMPVAKPKSTTRKKSKRKAKP
jgi:hypothetical protein